MMFRRRKDDIANAQRRRLDAEARDAEAKAQNRAVQQLAMQSRTVTARLRHEVEKNGWTELLQTAWGAR